jgi:AcrR family transcriptional regulator
VKSPKATDGNTLRTQRTMERILAGSLRLFNSEGEGNVTTGLIADALDMSPGNLYYHFRNKEQIVEALFRRFEARMDVEPRRSAHAGQAMEDLWLYLHLAFEAIWEYRFIYRNLDDLLARNRRLRDVYNRIVDRKLAAFEALCDSLVGAGAMKASPEEIHALGRNVIVVATYWLNFQSIRRRRDDVSADDLGEGAYQVLSLVAPYLRGEARDHLDALGARYID